jgi:hypothetical protein
VARVVELGFGTRWPTRVRMRVRWACSGGHGAVPAWAGCLMILGLYPASTACCRPAPWRWSGSMWAAPNCTPACGKIRVFFVWKVSTPVPCLLQI